MSNLKVLYDVRAKRMNYQRYVMKEETIRTRLEYPSGGGGEKSGTPTNVNTIEYTLADYIEATTALDKAKAEWKKAEAEALLVIAKLTDPNQVAVLTMKFVDFLPLSKIALALGYSERQAIRIYLRGIKKIKDVTKCH